MLKTSLIIAETVAEFVSVKLVINIFLHSLQGQFDGVHFFIFYLKSPSDADGIIS